MTVETYNPSVRALTLHRIATALAFIGIFIAGSLSLKYIFNIDLPCGPGGGCGEVTSSDQARWAGIPVAYFGLGAYLVLAGIASARLLAGMRANPMLSLAALGISGVGALASLFLQYQSFAIIGQRCDWCLASAVVMSLLFLTNAALHSASPENVGASKSDMMLVPALGIAAAVGIGIMSSSLLSTKKTEVLAPPVATNTTATASDPANDLFTLEDLAPSDSLTMGPDTAPIKIVEFSDLLCGSCRRAYPELKQIVNANEGKVQLIFRHFPLFTTPGHEMSTTAAFLAEYAAEKGKGWEFVEAVNAIPPKEITTPEPLLNAIQEIGLDPGDARSRMNQEDPAFKRVNRDLQFVLGRQLRETPTFLLLMEGQQPRLAKFAGLIDLLKQEPYSKVLEADAP